MQFISKTITYTGDPVFNIYPLGDVHIGSTHHDKPAWLKDIQRVNNDPYGLWLGMGDFAESIIPGDKRFQAREIDPDFSNPEILSEIALRQTEVFIDQVKPISDKCLGLLEGNHELTILTKHGINLIRVASNSLDVPYLGEAALYRLTFKKTDTDGQHIRSRNLVIYAEHGHGGGKKTGSKVNSIEDLSRFYEADIYLMGHVHQRLVTRATKIEITGSGKPSIVPKSKLFGLTGCYYHSVSEGPGSYANRAGFPPADIGCIQLSIRPNTGEMSSTY